MGTQDKHEEHGDYEFRLSTVERKVDDHENTLHRVGTGGVAAMATQAYASLNATDVRLRKLENAAIKMATYGGIALFFGGTAATLVGAWLKKVLGI